LLRFLEPYLVEDEEAWVESVPPTTSERVPAPAPRPTEAEVDREVDAVMQAAATAPVREVWVYGEPTPNPNAMKFTASVPVVEQGTRSFTRPEQAEGDPLGGPLFAIDGVRVVFAVNDFVTVTKSNESSWMTLQPRIEAVLAEYLEA
jgi:hypothetical protein